MNQLQMHHCNNGLFIRTLILKFIPATTCSWYSTALYSKNTSCLSCFKAASFTYNVNNPACSYTCIRGLKHFATIRWHLCTAYTHTVPPQYYAYFISNFLRFCCSNFWFRPCTNSSHSGRGLIQYVLQSKFCRSQVPQ